VEELRVDVKAFIEERDWAQFHSPKNLAMALSVEVSEVVEHFQWLTEEQSRNLSAEKLADVREEIGDVMIYLTELADKLGLDPVEAARTKVAINKEKYPRTSSGETPPSTRSTSMPQASDVPQVFVFPASNDVAQENLKKSMDKPVEREKVLEALTRSTRPCARGS
jgi:NTP pyrophosphatase (non-canonical NTP hydrolase)